MWFQLLILWALLSINNNKNKKLICNCNSIIHTLGEIMGQRTEAVSTKCLRAMEWRFLMLDISSLGNINWWIQVTKAHILIIKRLLMLTCQDLFKCILIIWLANNNFLQILKPPIKVYLENSDFKAERKLEVERI